MVILGIDPGTATTGYGVIKNTKGELKCVDFGCIKTPSDLSPGKRLHILHKELRKLIKKHLPAVLAVEDIFFFKNQKTAVTVAQAKGVVLLSGAEAKLLIREYTPLQIKQAVSSYGRAEKIQMQKMVKHILGLEEIPKPDDAADALACAICYAYEPRANILVVGACPHT